MLVKKFLMSPVMILMLEPMGKCLIEMMIVIYPDLPALLQIKGRNDDAGRGIKRLSRSGGWLIARCRWSRWMGIDLDSGLKRTRS